MTVLVRRAWLQKHPTPTASGGDFHWHPREGEADVRAAFAERLPGVNAGAVMWRFAPGHVAWAQTFAATSPSDGRRYVGLAVASIEGDGAPATLLDDLVPTRAEPWTEGRAEDSPGVVFELPDIAAVARALLDGGNAGVGDGYGGALPRAIAAIERWMPAWVSARPRMGAWLPEAPRRGSDRVAELVARAVADPTSRAAQAWSVACELVGDSDGLAKLIGQASPELVGDLNAWGRGRLAMSVDDLAERVIARVIATLIDDRDPSSVIAEARWHALLPAPARGELLAAVKRRSTYLETLIDA